MAAGDLSREKVARLGRIGAQRSAKKKAGFDFLPGNSCFGVLAGFDEPGLKKVLELGRQGEVRRRGSVLPEGLRELELLIERELQREAGQITLRQGSSVLQQAR